MRVELRAEARQDVVEGAGFYEEQRTGLGTYFVESILHDISMLATQAGIHEVAVARLRKLRPEPIDTIRGMQLRTAMRIHTREFYLPLPASFVGECGRLGLEICILYEA